MLSYKGAPGKVLAYPVQTAAPLLALWLPMLAKLASASGQP